VLHKYPVVIVGAGPVGLVLACALQQKGVACKVIEKRAAPPDYSRAIGIHPIGLHVLESIGVLAEVLAQGVHIHKAHAVGVSGHLGSVSFEHCKRWFDFVTALPQAATEHILENRLRQLDPHALERNTAALTLQKTANTWQLEAVRTDGSMLSIQASYIVGCDGKHSWVRNAAGIAFATSRFTQASFIMGDYDDCTDWQTDAAVYLHRQGLIESFPLPAQKRRWVVQLPQTPAQPERKLLDTLVFERLGIRLDKTSNYGISSFRISQGLAKQFVKNQCVLVGDAAHLVSPIGGQGMNLGWINAFGLAQTLKLILRSPQRESELLLAYEQSARRNAQKAMRRANLFLTIGRARYGLWARDGIVRLSLNSGLAVALSRIFTMQDFELVALTYE